jgi:hypothetical protein
VLKLPEGMTTSTVQLFQADGRSVFRQSVSSREARLSLPDLNRGIYLLHIENAKGIYVKKLVKL